MIGAFRLAWRYLTHYIGRTSILVSALTLTLMIPMLLAWSIEDFQSRWLARAQSTPWVIGPKGSRFGLTMHALYFRGTSEERIPQRELKRIEKLQLAKTIPLFIHYQASGFPIVGTSREYFHLRGLNLLAGNPWERIGDCLIGYKVSQQLGLKPRDHLLSDPENAFDLSAAPPLRMRIAGVLEPQGTSDDEAVFVDIKTSWIIAGIGHGHDMANNDTAPEEHLHAADKSNLKKYNEVTDDNFKSFHFHGNSSEYPLTAIVAVTDSEKAETLLMGKFLAPEQSLQIVRPRDVIEEMLLVVTQLQRVFGWILIAFFAASGLLVLLIVWLSTRMRAKEFETLRLIGCSPWTATQLIVAELCITLTFSFLAALCIAFMARGIVMQWLERIAIA